MLTQAWLGYKTFLNMGAITLAEHCKQIGALGGQAGRGASKRRSAEHYEALAALRRKKKARKVGQK